MHKTQFWNNLKRGSEKLSELIALWAHLLNSKVSTFYIDPNQKLLCTKLGTKPLLNRFERNVRLKIIIFTFNWQIGQLEKISSIFHVFE